MERFGVSLPSTNRGNALLIILIAVALFAALSYAVTKSGRGGGSVTKEQTALDLAQVVQFASLVRSTVQRMVFTGTAAADLVFCSSGDTDGVCLYGGATGDLALCETGSACVFAPEGGGLSPREIPEAIKQAPSDTLFFVETQYNLGIVNVGSSSADILMYGLLSTDACDQLNTQLGLALPTPTDAGFIPIPAARLDDAYDGEPVQCAKVFGGLNLMFYTLYEQ